MPRFAYHEREIVKLVYRGMIAFTPTWRIYCAKRKEGETVITKCYEYPNNYGFMRLEVNYDGRRLQCMSHRLVWQYHNGDIPDGFEILHLNGIRDDNRPENLKTDTHSNIMLYSASKIGDYKGVPFGERNHMSILTPEKVTELRRRHKKGEPIYKIAEDMGISSTAACYAALGDRSWKHVQDGLNVSAPRRLTPEEVRGIREGYAETKNYEERLQLANKYNVSYRTVWEVAIGKTYKEVGGVPIIATWKSNEDVKKRRKEVIKDYQAGMPVKEIMSKHGFVNPSAIHTIRKAEGIKARRKISEEEKEIILTLHWGGMPVKEIAVEVGRCDSSVRNVLNHK